MTKICIKCGTEKLLQKFYKDKQNKDGHRNDCVECNKNRSLEYQKENAFSVNEKNRKWMSDNPEKVISSRKKSGPAQNKKRKERYANDLEYREKIIVERRSFRADPKNRESLKKTRRKSVQKRLQNPLIRIQFNLRRRMNHVLKNYTKTSSTVKLVGCSWEELRSHIENQFTEGMSWENYGQYGWHIDHIKPCCSFNFLYKEDQQKCFHWSNLRPLWWRENLAKGSKF